MSTKAIREALEWMKSECGEPRVSDALLELAALEKQPQISEAVARTVERATDHMDTAFSEADKATTEDARARWNNVALCWRRFADGAQAVLKELKGA